MDPRIEQLIIAGRLHEDLRAAANARLAKPVVPEARRRAERDRPRRRRFRSAFMAPRRAR